MATSRSGNDSPPDTAILSEDQFDLTAMETKLAEIGAELENYHEDKLKDLALGDTFQKRLTDIVNEMLKTYEEIKVVNTSSEREEKRKSFNQQIERYNLFKKAYAKQDFLFKELYKLNEFRSLKNDLSKQVIQIFEIVLSNAPDTITDEIVENQKKLIAKVNENYLTFQETNRSIENATRILQALEKELEALKRKLPKRGSEEYKALSQLSTVMDNEFNMLVSEIKKIEKFMRDRFSNKNDVEITTFSELVNQINELQKTYELVEKIRLHPAFSDRETDATKKDELFSMLKQLDESVTSKNKKLDEVQRNFDQFKDDYSYNIEAFKDWVQTLAEEIAQYSAVLKELRPQDQKIIEFTGNLEVIYAELDKTGLPFFSPIIPPTLSLVDKAVPVIQALEDKLEKFKSSYEQYQQGENQEAKFNTNKSSVLAPQRLFTHPTTPTSESTSTSPSPSPTDTKNDRRHGV